MQDIVVYCGLGYRGSMAARAIEDLSHKKNVEIKRVFNLAGGLKSWKELD